MGWSRGSELIRNVWDLFREFVEPSERAEVLADLINMFADQDWDCWDEIVDMWEEAEEALVIFNASYMEII